MKKRILISAAGTATAWHIIQTIKNRFPQYFEVWACDINPVYLIPSSTLADYYLQVPSIFDSGYYEHMLDLMLRHNINIFVPLIDFDLSLFPCDNIDLVSNHIYSTAPPKHVSDLLSDKWNAYVFFKKHGIPSALSFTKDSIDEVNEYFIKPRKGFGSQGTMKLKGPEALRVDTAKYIVQEICHSPEVTIEIFNYGESLKIICRERIEVKAGVCTKARLYFDRELHEVIKKITKNLPFPVASCVQLMKNSANNWVITDVNLRLGAGTALSSSVGWDLTSAALAIWGNLPYNPELYLNDFSEDKYVVRVFHEVVMT